MKVNDSNHNLKLYEAIRTVYDDLPVTTHMIIDSDTVQIYCYGYPGKITMIHSILWFYEYLFSYNYIWNNITWVNNDKT